MALLLAACSTTSPTAVTTESTSVPTTTSVTAESSSATTTTVVPELDTGDIVGFDLVDITLEGESLLVALADTSTLRSQGLMGVVDMGDLDGMLFAWDDLTTGSFWMKDTLIPLDIVFFDADGEQVSSATMTPCEADPCERYAADGAYQWALETPAGTTANRTALTLVP